MADSLSQLAQFMAAERHFESGGDYTVVNSIGASGAYQFLQGTWDGWIRQMGSQYAQYAGQSPAHAPPAVQDAVASYAMTQYFNEFGSWADVAKAWYGGGGFQEDNQTASNSGGPSLDQYAANVTGYMNSQGADVATAGASAASTGTDGGTGTTDSSGTAIPSPPGMNDIPGLVDYIKQYFGADAWLLDLPGGEGAQVAQVIEDAVAQGYGNDAAYIQGKLATTPWFQQTSQAYQQYLAQKASNPGDYSFTVAGSKAQGSLAQVKAQAASQGVTISPLEAQQLATYQLEYGWNSAQLNAALGDTVYYKGNGPGQTNAGSVISQLQSAASQYLLPVSPTVMQQYAQNIAGGTQTVEQFDAYLKQAASLKWTGMASQIQQGYTPNQIVDSLRNNAASLMEVDPSSIDFVNNPMYSKILDYVPPNSQNGIHTIMTQSEMDQYLKNTPQFDTTQNARDDVATLANQITQTFGRAPS